jgi:hypothetical protein
MERSSLPPRSTARNRSRGPTTSLSTKTKKAAIAAGHDRGGQGGGTFIPLSQLRTNRQEAIVLTPEGGVETDPPVRLKPDPPDDNRYGDALETDPRRSG